MRGWAQLLARLRTCCWAPAMTCHVPRPRPFPMFSVGLERRHGAPILAFLRWPSCSCSLFPTVYMYIACSQKQCWQAVLEHNLCHGFDFIAPHGRSAVCLTSRASLPPPSSSSTRWVLLFSVRAVGLGWWFVWVGLGRVLFCVIWMGGWPAAGWVHFHADGRVHASPCAFCVLPFKLSQLI